MPVDMLTGIDTHEVSVVDRAANRRLIALTKAEGKIMKAAKAVLDVSADGEGRVQDITKAQSEEGQEFSLGLYRLLKGFEGSVKAEQLLEVLKAAGVKFPEPVVKAAEPKEVEPEINLEELSEPVRKELKKQEEKQKAQSAELLELRKSVSILKDEKQTEKFKAIAKGFEAVGTIDELGVLLKDINDADSELAERVQKALELAQERIAKGELFSEAGVKKNAGNATSDPGDKLEKLAKARAKEDKIPLAKAWEVVMEENPELVKASN